MILALSLQLAAAVICQLNLKYVYETEDVANGLRMPPPTYLEDVSRGLRAFTAVGILISIGLWTVKFNYLIFFYRIFCSANRLYRNLWWLVFIVTLGCLGAFLSLASYECTLSDVEVIMTTCTEPSSIRLQWIRVEAAFSVDAFNDLLSTMPSPLPKASTHRVHLTALEVLN